MKFFLKNCLKIENDTKENEDDFEYKNIVNNMKKIIITPDTKAEEVKENKGSEGTWKKWKQIFYII